MTDAPPEAPLDPRVRRGVLVALVGLALLVYGWGLRGNLPYFEGVDETFAVGCALDMVTRGSWNPKWFGNPGSTLIYPLSVGFAWWYALTGDGALIYRNPELPELMADGGGMEFYFLARLFNLVYAVGLVPLTYLVGRRAFGERAGLLGALLMLPCPVLVEHAKLVRSDAAGAFFALVALWAQLRLLDEDGGARRPWVLAGLAVGLATGTRYLLLALMPGLLVAAWLRGLRSCWRQLALALVAIPLGFLLCTPYALLEAGKLYHDVFVEARSEHLGADGLGFGGNLAFYLRSLASQGLPWLTLAGVGLALARRESRGPALILGAFCSALVVGMSLLALHWHRWLIPLYPPLACVAALPLVWVARRLKGGPAGWAAALALALVAGGYARVGETLDVQRRAVAPHTRVQAREWMLANLPAGAAIGQEWYGAALARTGFRVVGVHHLGERDWEAWRADVRYLVTSSSMVDRYRASAARYPDAVAFYDRLAREGRELTRIAPVDGATGPTITIYELPR